MPSDLKTTTETDVLQNKETLNKDKYEIHEWCEVVPLVPARAFGARFMRQCARGQREDGQDGAGRQDSGRMGRQDDRRRLWCSH